MLRIVDWELDSREIVASVGGTHRPTESPLPPPVLPRLFLLLIITAY